MDEKLWKDINYRKGLGIAFFNSNNAAVEMVKLEGIKPVIKGKKGAKGKKIETLEMRVRLYRDYFIKEYADYYTKVIAPIGTNYKAEDSIAKLKATKNLEDLKVAWVLLSADERKDGEIRKVAQELKAKYIKNEKA